MVQQSCFFDCSAAVAVLIGPDSEQQLLRGIQWPRVCVERVFVANGEGTPYNSTRCVPPPPEVDGEVFDLFTTSGFMGWKTRDKLIEKRINIVKERVIGSSTTIKHCWYNMLTIDLRAKRISIT